MNNTKKENGLVMREIESKATPITSIGSLDEIKNYIKTDSLIIAYLDYKVLIGRYINGALSFYNNDEIELKYVQRIRIFNENEELLIWRSEGKFKGRHRLDNGKGNVTWAVDNWQVLFGTDAEKLNEEYTLIKEERGTEIILPVPNIFMDPKKKKNRVKIKTRNYIDFIEETHQATYVDCRLVEFTFGEDNGRELK
jgi:CRISPR-associated protein (TIGR03984 family)